MTTDTTTQSDETAADLLQSILPALQVVDGPDEHGDYSCWCPFHRDTRDGEPHPPDFRVSQHGYTCHTCGATGELPDLAEHLGIASDRAEPTCIAPSHTNRLLPRIHNPAPPAHAHASPPRHCALFDGLVDLVQADGLPAFLVRAGRPEAAYAPRVVQRAAVHGKPVLPPEPDAIPWLLPRAHEVLAHFHAGRECPPETDARLYADLVAHHRAASQLPDAALYGLLALWDMHTYLLEHFHYSPIICLHGLPERGKSRTGRAMIHVAYRGLHVPSTRHSFISRVASDFRATLFFDLRDVWRKLLRDATEEVVLQRFERDVYVPRVDRPAAGPHRDTRFYPVFGPTIIATNVAPDRMLDSRGL
ncbi:MAG: hypothetical protein PVH68_06835, partial [Armatimonadota bacterium]